MSGAGREPLGAASSLPTAYGSEFSPHSFPNPDIWGLMFLVPHPRARLPDVAQPLPSSEENCVSYSSRWRAWRLGHPGQGPPLPSAPLHASHLSSSSQALSEEVIPDAAVRPLRPWRSELRVLLCCLFNHLVPELQQLPLLLQKMKPPPGTQGLGPTFPAQLLLVPA